MLNKERFAQGMTPQQYIDQMTMNKDRFLSVAATTSIGAAERALLDRLAGARHALVITEDWCGAAIASVPFVFKLGEELPRLEIRVFLRDQNPDIMDQYLKNGRYRSIPVFAFFDERMNELARFIERRPG
jgi:Thioredoxin